MLTYIQILYLMIFCIIISCASPPIPNNNSSSTMANSQTANSSCASTDFFGGITCEGDSFFHFISDGTKITLSDYKKRKPIDCAPSNKGGMLAKMKVSLMQPLDLNKSNNNSNININQTSLQINIHNNTTKDGNNPNNLFKFKALVGELYNNNVNITFVLNNEVGKKKLIAEGTIDKDNFSGTIRFENENNTNNTVTQGTLGTFKLTTCSVFNTQ